MKILLTTRRDFEVQTNPIALLDLAAYWRRQGHEVVCHYLDQLKRRPLADAGFDLVALSVLQTPETGQPYRDIRFLRERFRTDVVVGGKWTRTLEPGSRALALEAGIRIHQGPGETLFGCGETEYSEYPAWDPVDFDSLGEVRCEVMSARGCPFHCHFCHNTEPKVTFFHPRRTARNIEFLLGRGIAHVFICDDIFTLRASHMEAVYAELRALGIPIENRCEFFTHVRFITPATVAWIRRYRPVCVGVGVESGDDRMLGLMGKGFDSQTALEKLRMLSAECEAPVRALFLIGYPGETEESLTNTLEFIHKIRGFTKIWVSYFQPVPGTVGHLRAMERSDRMPGSPLRGSRNTQVAFVDPSLTPGTLRRYRAAMAETVPR